MEMQPSEQSLKVGGALAWAQFERVFRQAAVIKGHNRDTAWFSMLDSEWPTIKTGFERWLDVANFDETGKQRQSLMQLRDSGAAS